MKTKRLWMAVLASSALLLASGGSLRAGDKVQTVGAGGLKIEGKVASDDPKVSVSDDDKTPSFAAKLFKVKLQGGKRYVITLDAANTKQLDPLLVVQDKAGKVLGVDDDGGEGLNSRLVFPAPKDDTYHVYAAALFGEGAFTLKIAEAGAAADPKKVFNVDKNLIIEGTLTADTKSIVYQVKMIEGKTYRIDLMSKQLDAFLVLQDPDGKKLDEDDDGGGGLNSRLVHKAAATGNFRIVASSLGMIGRGNFILEVREE